KDETTVVESIQDVKKGLPILLGKYEGDKGNAVVDLCEAPHILLAGSYINDLREEFNLILESLVKKSSPSEVSFLLIDSMHIAFYNDNLDPINPYSSDPLEPLQWLSKELKRRYNVLAKADCPTINEYNAQHTRIMPYIVVCVFNLADMREKAKECFGLLDILKKGRAVGLHVIAMTSSPNASFLTPDFLINFPVRIALRLNDDASASELLVNKPGADAFNYDQKYVYDVKTGNTNIIKMDWPSDRKVDAAVRAFNKKK
ncbi:MAG: hypothetical protein J5746_00425, partial [Victivallales bacterium]|nr:hypothetical protein [Victivallales bacterium]